jgi:hypothetical protein
MASGFFNFTSVKAEFAQLVIWPDEGVAIPAAFTATIDDSRLPCLLMIDVAMEGLRPVCVRVEATRRAAGPPLTNANMRLPLAQLARQAALLIMSKATPGKPGSYGLDPFAIFEENSEVGKRLRESSKRAADHQERLRHVADAYRTFLAAGDPAPRRATANLLGYKESYIGRLLHEARRTTPPLLGQADPGRAIEHPLRKTRKAKR